MAKFPCLFRNISGRPLELHGAGAVRVLAPGATLLVDTPDAELDALEQKGSLSRHAAPPPKPAPKVKPEPQPKAKSRLRATSAAQKGDKA